MSPSDPRDDVTALLLAWERGEQQAPEELMQAVYGELRRIASCYLRGERPGHTLQPTALVHEVYLRLIHTDAVAWRDRAHFFGLAAQMMRRILIDHARSKRYAKRGGGQVRVPLEAAERSCYSRPDELMALDDALTELAAIDPRKAKLVELRYFGGLQFQEIARMLECSVSTINRDWRGAKAWLYLRLNPDCEESA
ncbi:MAG: sigma-70 family RNA polymerase sigma factor [Holophagales bacterium]|nr:sigma-70 family RNA polymerase sigma factor [Holophagales bacterium]